MKIACSLMVLDLFRANFCNLDSGQNIMTKSKARKELTLKKVEEYGRVKFRIVRQPRSTKKVK